MALPLITQGVTVGWNKPCAVPASDVLFCRNSAELVPAYGSIRWKASYIIVIYEELDEDTVRVVTAYDVPELHWPGCHDG